MFEVREGGRFNRDRALEFLQDNANLPPLNLDGEYHIISPGGQGWWSQDSVVWNCIDISKNQFGCPLVFIWGEQGLFSDIPRSEHLYVNEYHVQDMESTRTGLRVTFQNTNDGWFRIMLAIQEYRRLMNSGEPVDLEDILRLTISLIGSIIPRGGLLSESEIKGLYGELVLFYELIQIAEDNGISNQAVLDSWKGYLTPARRDFSREGNPNKIEVKSTGGDERRHKIDNYLQLVEVGQERLYLFSVHAKLDASGSDSLNRIIARIRGRLSPGHVTSLNSYLSQYGDYGYREEHARHYDLPILIEQFDSELYDMSQADYFRGFGDSPAPVASTDYSYTLLLDAATPLGAQERQNVLLSLIN